MITVGKKIQYLRKQQHMRDYEEKSVNKILL